MGLFNDLDIDLKNTPKLYVKKGQLYQLGNHRLLCGDATLKECWDFLMGGRIADLCITDPPYNVDYNASRCGRGTTHKKIENDNIKDFREFLIKSYKGIADNLKDGGVLYSFYATRSSIDFLTAIEENNFYFSAILIGHKNNFAISFADYKYDFEPCFYGWKKGGSHVFFGDKGSTTSLYWQMTPNDVHPTIKPQNILEKFIKNSSREGELIIDPFAGSGSTMVACDKLNRICYTMELDEQYCQNIISRWEINKGQKAILLGEINV